jgi:hypothetical protein
MSKLNLHELTSLLLQSFLPAAARNHNLLVNDVPDGICIDSDRELAASVIGGLLSDMVTHVENSCIRLSAKSFDGIILLTVTDGNGHNNCGIIEGVQEAQPFTEKPGMIVSIANQSEKTATISFSFSNTAA